MKTKMIFKNITSVTLALVIAATTFSFHFEKSQAWEQGANGSHEEINKTAVSRFLNAFASNPKFANSPLVTNQQFLGNQTTSATLNSYEFSMQKSSLTFSQWVTHGGFSADEPEVWACVRHFYDPLAVNGINELTDHLALHSQVYETISAKDWAFKATENPYSWRKALEYYKQSMEIPDDAQISVVKGMDFRDTDITVSSAAEARSVYLGKAFRALGETMHMMADITQPSHVRNDSHPSIDSDPLESTVNKDTVRLVRDAPVVPSVGSAIDSAANLEDMYEEIAIFTNSNFYTDDTVSDAASGVKQSNHENPYPHPQFSELTLDTKTGVYSKTFNGKSVRMTQKSFSSYMLGPLWTDYTVPAAFATEQAEVMVPIAIKANAKVINSFFPTFDLTLDVKENKNVSTNGDANYKEYSLGTELKHLSASDVEWRQQFLTIKYTGPAELWGETKGKARKIADIKFKAGVPVNPVTVFVGDEKYQKADKYQVNSGDNIYLLVNAGGRKITSTKYTIPASSVQLSITPAKLNGVPDTEYKFTAIPVNPPDKAKYSWTLNGKVVQETYSISYTTRFSSVGNYTVAVRLIDEAGRELASASAVADIKVASPTPTPSVSKPAASSTTARNNLSWLLASTKFTGSLTGTMRYNSYNSLATPQAGTGQASGELQFPHLVVGVPERLIGITWSGTSFSGKRTPFKYVSDEIKGSVSADGSLLTSLEYKYTYKLAGSNTGDFSEETFTITLNNVPISATVSSTNGKAVQNCVGTITRHSKFYNDGSGSKKAETYSESTFSNVVWSEGTPVLQVSFVP